MKRKQLVHPRLYLTIVERTYDNILVEYQDNEFYDDGKRIIKKSNLNLGEDCKSFSNNIEILNKLNQQEFNKITSYIKTQYKILKYHQKNNNSDAILTVSESIKVMESFKRKF
jgi:nicotinamide riboside kinase